MPQTSRVVDDANQSIAALRPSINKSPPRLKETAKIVKTIDEQAQGVEQINKATSEMD
jgi:hypothetical protein